MSETSFSSTIGAAIASPVRAGRGGLGRRCHAPRRRSCAAGT